MKKVRWVSATVGTALVAAMFALPGAGVAHASANGAGAVAVARRRRNSEV